MKLFIRFGSLARFQSLFDTNEYLKKVLTKTGSNVYLIEADDTKEIERILVCNRIKYAVK